MNFKSKAEYLAAVVIWKEQYVTASVECRRTKHALREAHRACSSAGIYMWNAASEQQADVNKKVMHAEFAVRSAISAFCNARENATQLLHERAAGKIEANRQYTAARELQAA